MKVSFCSGGFDLGIKRFLTCSCNSSLSLLAFVVFFGAGCDDKPSSGVVNPVQPASVGPTASVATVPAPSPEPTPREQPSSLSSSTSTQSRALAPASVVLPSPTGGLLFQTELTSDELKEQRLEFAKTKELIEVDFLGHPMHQFEVGYFNFDVQNVPQAPLFGLYHEPAGFVHIAMKLSPSFLYVIPEAIQTEIKKQNVDRVDLFLVIQALPIEEKNDSILFRPHFWVGTPGPHDVRTNEGGHVKVALYDFESSIDQDLKTNQLTSSEWSIHPGNGQALYSPLDGCRVAMIRKSNNSGWTLVVDDREKRAAVTLHGVYSDDVSLPSYDQFRAELSKNRNKNTLEGIMEIMKRPIEGQTQSQFPLFSGLLTRLEELIR